jgi:hypothetical protein
MGNEFLKKNNTTSIDKENHPRGVLEKHLSMLV